MPPKKMTEKAIAAETKKQNTIKAKNILDEMRKELGKSESDGGSIVKKPPRNKSEKDKPAKSYKKSTEAKEIVAKPNGTPHDNVSTTNSEALMQTLSNSTATGSGSSSVKNGGIPERIETPPNSSTSDQTKSIELPKPKSKESATRKSSGNVGNKKSVALSKAGSSHGSAYQYEIDCKDVADSINVNDLKIHLEKQLKIDGKKGNLGSTVSIVCEGQKVVIKSATFFPKKALRFLSKKFLKKNWNIRVLSKNVHSYEYKYVGTL